MTKNCPHYDLQGCSGAPRDRLVCGLWYAGIILVLMNTCEAAPAEQAVVPIDPLKPALTFTKPEPPFAAPAPLAPTVLLPMSLEGIELPQTQTFPTRDFRPRGRSILEREPSNVTFEDAPMLHNTTAWQRLSDYRSHGRVRLLTLWETAGSTVALLAGKHGEPSLQWTSRSMNRGGATRGVFDQLFSVSLANANRTLHFAPRMNNESPTKSSQPAPQAGPAK